MRVSNNDHTMWYKAAFQKELMLWRCRISQPWGSQRISAEKDPLELSLKEWVEVYQMAKVGQSKLVAKNTVDSFWTLASAASVVSAFLCLSWAKHWLHKQSIIFRGVFDFIYVVSTTGMKQLMGCIALLNLGSSNEHPGLVTRRDKALPAPQM